MRLKFGFAACVSLAGIMGLLGTAAAAPVFHRQSASAQPALPALADVPLYFEANAGQSDPQAAFLARAGDCQILLAPTMAQLVLRAEAAAPSATDRTIRMEFVDANPSAPIQGLAKTDAKINYLLGADPTQWHMGVGTYSRVQVQGIYPGIDLVYYGNQHRFEYDFALAPGADPQAIAIRIEGADQVSIDAQGDLVLSAAGRSIQQPKPTIYQVIGGTRRTVAGAYRQTGPNTVAFAVGQYDASLPLVIDPVLVHSSYLGGNSIYQANVVKVDAAGSVYVAGTTYSFLTPLAPPPEQPTNFAQVGTTNGEIRGRFFGDAFVAKFDSNLTNLIFLTYLGGTNDESVFSLAFDAQTNIYLTGWTSSTNFPINTNTILGGLTSPTNIGGTFYRGVARTIHTFPTDAYVAKLDMTGSNLVYSAYIGGDLEDVGQGIAVDTNTGDVYITGYTASTNFPVTFASAFQTNLNSTYPSIEGTTTNTVNAFLLKIEPNVTNSVVVTNNGQTVTNTTVGPAVVYSTYLGGDHFDYAQGLTLDAAGHPCIVGYTDSTNFPTTPNALQSGWQLNQSTNAARQFRGPIFLPNDGFVARFDLSRSNLDQISLTQARSNALLYSSLLGGTNDDRALAVAADAFTNLYVVGYSFSRDLTAAATNPANLFFAVSTNNGRVRTNSDAFLVKLDFSTTNPSPAIAYSYLFGSTNSDSATAVAVSPDSSIVYVGGTTRSTNFPTTTNLLAGLLTTTNAGGQDGFIAAFGRDGSTKYSTYLGGTGNDFIYGIAANAANDAYVVGQTFSTDFPEVEPFQEPAQRTNNAFVAKIVLNNTNVTAIVQANPATNLLGSNLWFVVDGTIYSNGPVTFTNWQLGSRHIIATFAYQGGATNRQHGSPTNIFLGDTYAATNSRFIWSSWSNGGMLTNTVYPTAATNVYTANFTPQYFVTLNTVNGGGVNPGTGWYDAGNLSVQATAGAGNAFEEWILASSDGTFATNTANPATLLVNGPLTNTAVFSVSTVAGQLVILTNGLGTVSPNLAGQTLQSGRRYSLTARPAANWLFAGWTGGATTNVPTLNFTMTDGLVLQANFVPNPYVSSVGRYVGLFYVTNDFREESSGSFRATVTTQGRFSSSLRVAGRSYSLSGQFSPSGSFYGFIRRSSDTNVSPLSVTLQLDETNGAGISGMISQGTWLAEIQSFRVTFSATNPPPQQGQKFTFIIPVNRQYLSQPGGSGYGYVNVNSSGGVSISTHLGDGTAVSQSTYLSPQSQFPYYAALYGSRGSILGWLTLTNALTTDLTNDVSGMVSWYRPAQIYSRYYPGGFTVETNIIGSVFTPTNGVRLLSITNGLVVMEMGDVGSNRVYSVLLSSNNVVTNLGTIQSDGSLTNYSTNKLTLKLTSSSGLMHGSFHSPVKNQSWTVNGVVLQKQNYAAGYFRGTNHTGTTILTGVGNTNMILPNP